MWKHGVDESGNYAAAGQFAIDLFANFDPRYLIRSYRFCRYLCVNVFVSSVEYYDGAYDGILSFFGV